MDAPQEVVGALFCRRGLECGEGDALRGGLAHDMADDAALARRIEALDDEEERVALTPF